MSFIVKVANRNTTSINLDLVSIQDMVFLLKNYPGYVDGDKHTLELYDYCISDEVVEFYKDLVKP